MIRILKNTKRRVLRKRIGVVHLQLHGKIPFFREKKSFVEKKVMPPPPFSLFELRENLERLSRNHTVKALLIEVGQPEFQGLADIHELRDIILNFRKSGKPVWVLYHHLSFNGYYLATAADKIFMLRASVFHVNGMSSTVNFYKQFLAQHGFEVQVLQVTPFKSAGNFLAYDEMPDEQREMINWLIDSMYDSITTAMADGRGKSIEEVRKMIDSCPMTDQEALDNGWIDGVIDGGIEEIVVEEFGKIPVTDYFRALKFLTIPKRKKGVAIIAAEGSIVDGSSSNPPPIPIPLFGGKKMGDITVVQSIRWVIKNKKRFRAVVFFVDSPGGSAVASEAILQEMRKLSKVLPIYTYFHNVAASGGYYISSFGQPIYATPVTITGSIGVINMKFINKEFFDKQKIKRYNFKRGEKADLLSGSRRWTDEEYDRLKELLLEIYNIFIQHVAESRGLEHDYVDSIGGGRVWTGAQGLEKKLIDKQTSFTQLLQDLDKEFGGITPEVVPSRVKKPITPILEKTSIEGVIEAFNGVPQLLPYLDINFSI